MSDKTKRNKIFTKRRESTEETDDEPVSKGVVLEDIKNVVTDSRLIHLLTEQISETYLKRAATRSEDKRIQYDDEILKMSEDRGRLYDRINAVQRKYMF